MLKIFRLLWLSPEGLQRYVPNVVQKIYGDKRIYTTLSVHE